MEKRNNLKIANMNILKKLLRNKKLSKYDDFVMSLQNIYDDAPIDFGGGCSYEKALTMCIFIKELVLKTSVDIGVYRGRSLFPQALAHKCFSGGIVYGIDPYDNTAAKQNDKPELKQVLEDFAKNTDFNKIHNEVNSLIQNNQLTNNCKLLREKSQNAKSFFLENEISIGLVHIDGNHDTSYVIQDVNDYLPLVHDGGIIILDDISWDSVKPAMDMLYQKCFFVGKTTDAKNDFAIFLKEGSKDVINISKKVFTEIKSYNYPAS